MKVTKKTIREAIHSNECLTYAGQYTKEWKDDPMSRLIFIARSFKIEYFDNTKKVFDIMVRKYWKQIWE